MRVGLIRGVVRLWRADRTPYLLMLTLAACVIVGGIVAIVDALNSKPHPYAYRGRVEYDPVTMRVIAVEGPLRINAFGRWMEVPAGVRYPIGNGRLDLERGAIVPVEKDR